MTAYINLSGGVDSTYYLWRWLRENPEKEILVHHCLYLTRRVKQEKMACEKILEYLRKNNLKNFQYVETGLQRGTLLGRVQDIELLSGLSAVVIKSDPNIDTILLPYSKEETASLNRHVIEHGGIEGYDPTHRYTKFNQVVEIINGKKFNYHMYKDETGGIISKYQMMKEMPEELFGMTWYCRTPIGEHIPCRICHACRKVKRAKNRLREEGKIL